MVNLNEGKTGVRYRIMIIEVAKFVVVMLSSMSKFKY